MHACMCIYIYTHILGNGEPRSSSVKKLHDRFEHGSILGAENSLFHWSNRWCLFLTIWSISCGSRMARPPGPTFTWSSVTKHEPKCGIERDKKAPFLLSTMLFASVLCYNWLVVLSCLSVERFNYFKSHWSKFNIWAHGTLRSGSWSEFISWFSLIITISNMLYYGSHYYIITITCNYNL